MIGPADPGVSLVRQCELLGLARASYHYVPAGEASGNLEVVPVAR